MAQSNSTISISFAVKDGGNGLKALTMQADSLKNMDKAERSRYCLLESRIESKYGTSVNGKYPMLDISLRRCFLIRLAFNCLRSFFVHAISKFTIAKRIVHRHAEIANNDSFAEIRPTTKYDTANALAIVNTK